MNLDTGVALISLADAKEYLKVTGDEENNILQTLINSVSGWVERYVGFPMVRAERTEYYNGDGSRDLILRCRPLVSVASIHIDELRVFGADTLISSADYFLQKGRGIVRAFNLLGGWVSGEANIKVVSTAGWLTGMNDLVSAGGMPHDIRFAVKRTLDHHFRTGYTHRKLDISSETVGDMNTSYRTGELPADVKAILAPYRNLIASPHFSYAD